MCRSEGLGFLLAQQLVTAGETAVDVPATLAARTRVLRTGRSNKNATNDAMSVAVTALRTRDLRPARSAGEAHRLHRQGACRRQRGDARIRGYGVRARQAGASLATTQPAHHPRNPLQRRRARSGRRCVRSPSLKHGGLSQPASNCSPGTCQSRARHRRRLCGATHSERAIRHPSKGTIVTHGSGATGARPSLAAGYVGRRLHSLAPPARQRRAAGGGGPRF